MSGTSTEILSIPELARKIRIWTRSLESSTIVVEWAGNQQIFQIASREHLPVIIAHGDSANNLLTIKCVTGRVDIGSININYSWTINPYYTNLYTKQVQPLIESGFDLSLIDSNFRKDLFNEDLFLSTGADDFSAVTNLISNVQINGQNQDENSWHRLNANDVFSGNIYVTTPAMENRPTTSAPKQSSINLEWKYSYNQDFINNLDTRFYEYVNKRLVDHNVQWNDQVFTGYSVPYGYAIRIQTQLIDNVELIKNRRIVDLGTNRGQFLYPCIELGCRSIIGVQPLNDYNTAINEALTGLGHNDRACAQWGDAYDLHGLTEILKNQDTLLLLGTLYHFNNHYQLLETVTKTKLTGLIIDISVIDDDLNFYTGTEPSIKWKVEQQNVDESGWEFNGVNKNWTWVGHPNASWIIQTLQYLGWQIKSSVMHSGLRTRKPQLRHRGIVTAYR
jgi:hypothetical protein